MGHLEDEIRYHVNKRQQWESFGGKPIALVWGIVVTLTPLGTLFRLGLPLLYGGGIFAHLTLVFLKKKPTISFPVQILWLSGALIAFSIAYLLPWWGFFSNLAGHALSYLIWGGVIFYTGSIKARWWLVLSGMATVGIAVSLAVSLNGLVAGALFAICYFSALTVTKN